MAATAKTPARRGASKRSGVGRSQAQGREAKRGDAKHGDAKRSDAKRSDAKRRAPRRPAGGGARKWSAEVARRSDALDLAPGVFKQRSARGVALALKRSAEQSRRRKSTPFRSAMSMLNFEVNRAGKGLSAARRRVLERAKVEPRRVFHRNPV